MRDFIDFLRSILPFATLLLAWVMWSFKQKFVSKEEFRVFKDRYYTLQDKQERILTELNVKVAHIVKTIDKIETRVNKQGGF